MCEKVVGKKIQASKSQSKKDFDDFVHQNELMKSTGLSAQQLLRFALRFISAHQWYATTGPTLDIRRSAFEYAWTNHKNDICSRKN